jgi:hypothetical protein
MWRKPMGYNKCIKSGELCKDCKKLGVDWYKCENVEYVRTEDDDREDKEAADDMRSNYMSNGQVRWR